MRYGEGIERSENTFFLVCSRASVKEWVKRLHVGFFTVRNENQPTQTLYRRAFRCLQKVIQRTTAAKQMPVQATVAICSVYRCFAIGQAARYHPAQAELSGNKEILTEIAVQLASLEKRVLN